MIAVEVAYAGPEGAALVRIELSAGARVADAVAQAGLVERFGLDRAMLAFAIHGQAATEGTPLRANDRVELLLPLRIDPKVARRSRAAALPQAGASGRRPPRGKVG